ncbi:hypothetical protein HPB47_026745 [Ixodes persulcatus]|uniref:Uncharacterized protein n=1 Tax=Ixodes persulcatus TaxID=34615 RepID=A0AC60PXU4_IXOPE|nr:hypothetical protein HPB47_026745 [Ixodes persulcatus]
MPDRRPKGCKGVIKVRPDQSLDYIIDHLRYCGRPQHLPDPDCIGDLFCVACQKPGHISLNSACPSRLIQAPPQATTRNENSKAVTWATVAKSKTTSDHPKLEVNEYQRQIDELRRENQQLRIKLEQLATQLSTQSSVRGEIVTEPTSSTTQRKPRSRTRTPRAHSSTPKRRPMPKVSMPTNDMSIAQILGILRQERHTESRKLENSFREELTTLTTTFHEQLEAVMTELRQITQRDDSQAALLIRRDCTSIELPLPNISNDYREVIAAKIQPPGQEPFVAVCVYYRPNTGRARQDDFQWVRDIQQRAGSHPIIIGGDLNAQHPAWGYRRADPRGNALHDAMEMSALDLVNAPDTSTKWGCTPDSATPHRTLPLRLQDFDHYPILITLNRKKMRKRSTRARIDWNMYRQLTQQQPFDSFEQLASIIYKAKPAASEMIECDETTTCMDAHLANLWKRVHELTHRYRYGGKRHRDLMQLKKQYKSIQSHQQLLETETWHSTCAKLGEIPGILRLWGILRSILGKKKGQPPLKGLLLQGNPGEVETKVIRTFFPHARDSPAPDLPERTITNLDPGLDAPFTLGELTAALLKSKARSAPGHDKAGFRPNMGTHDCLWLLRRVINRKSRKLMPDYVLAIDMRKAFDNVRQEKTELISIDGKRVTNPRKQVTLVLGLAPITSTNGHIRILGAHIASCNITRKWIQTLRKSWTPLLHAVRRMSNKYGGARQSSAAPLARAVAVGRVLYGAPVYELFPKDLRDIEQLHRATLRTVTGLPKHTRMTLLQQLAPIPPIQTIITEARIRMQSRLDNSYQGKLTTLWD